VKRSPLVRKTPLRSRREGPALDKGEHPRAKEHKPPSAKPCEYCGREFLPFQSTQKVCPTLRCAKGYAQAQRKAKEKAERESFKARKERIKTIPDLIKEAQREFNAYIRERDRGQACICCGRPLGQGDVGGGYDCGHYRSTGSAPHLRFDERNAHAQNKQCNRWGAGRAVDYRVGLVRRIGMPAVDALEADNRTHKWTREELIAMKAHYRDKRKELEKGKACES
jgi:hypothetical protein